MYGWRPIVMPGTAGNVSALRVTWLSIVFASRRAVLRLLIVDRARATRLLYCIILVTLCHDVTVIQPTCIT